METNQGDVAIDSNGVAFTMRCTLGAAKKVNNAFGGFLAANDALDKMDFSAMCTIVAAGLGKSTAAEVEEQVFGAGQLNIHAKVKTYLELLANNGRVWVDPTKILPPPPPGPAPGNG